MRALEAALPLKLPDGALEILTRLEDAGFAAYAVGGCVRDSLLGRAPGDWDLCTAARPEEVKALFAGRRVLETGLRHGTVTVLLADAAYEVTTFRAEGAYSDGRRPDSVSFVPDLQTDLARRDFTVNAMAYAPRRGLADPFGGRRDLAAGLLRCVGDPDRRLAEDGLRVLRALRFASCCDFTLEQGTDAAVRRNAARLEKAAGERQRAELSRLLRGRGLLRVLLDYAQVLCVLLPELRPALDCAQPGGEGAGSVYEHCARAAAAYEGEDEAVKLALLLHGAGSGRFDGHEALSRALAARALERLRYDRATREEVLELIARHGEDIPPEPAEVRRALATLGAARFFRLAQLQRADALALGTQAGRERAARVARRAALARDILARGECLSRRELRFDGRDALALGLPPGRAVGRLLDRLLDEVLAGALPNERPALESRARVLASESRQESRQESG